MDNDPLLQEGKLRSFFLSFAGSSDAGALELDKQEFAELCGAVAADKTKAGFPDISSYPVDFPSFQGILHENDKFSDLVLAAVFPQPWKPEMNYTFYTIAMLSCFFGNMDGTLATTNSENLVIQTGYDVGMSGVLLGCYGLGYFFGVMIIFYTIKQTIHVFAFHGSMILLGAILYIVGCNLLSFPLLVIARVISGIGGAQQIAIYNGIAILSPPEKKTMYFVTANFLYLGMAIGPIMASNITTHTSHVALKVLKMTNNYGACHLLMVVYGILIVMLSWCLLPRDEVLFKGVPPEKLGQVVEVDKEWDAEEVKNVKLVMFVVYACCGCRHFIRQAVEVGLISILATEYLMGPFKASVLIGTVLCITPVYSLILASLARRYDDTKMISIIETFELLGATMLFRVGGITASSKVVMLLGAAVLYSNNTSQSGVLSSRMVKSSISGHPNFNQQSLVFWYELSVGIAYILGPVTARMLLRLSYTQNSLAVLILSSTVLQVLMTSSYFHIAPWYKRKQAECKKV